MNGRRLLLLSLLVVAAYMAVFGDKAPNDVPLADGVKAAPPRAKSQVRLRRSGPSAG